MSKTRLRFGIPDIDVPRSTGGTLNPSMFAGHVLLVIFCPTDAERAKVALAECQSIGPRLVDFDGWMLTVLEPPGVQHVSRPSAAALFDPDGSVWSAFCDIVPPDFGLERSEGATFLFSRGGSLEKAWSGVGHAAEVMDELSRPCFGG